MLFRMWSTHSKLTIVIGQLCLVLGILLSRLSHNGELAPFSIQLSDFWQGTLAGLGSVLLGVSIPLNLMAIRRWRDRRD